MIGRVIIQMIGKLIQAINVSSTKIVEKPGKIAAENRKERKTDVMHERLWQSVRNWPRNRYKKAT